MSQSMVKNKYAFYEKSTQSPKTHIPWFEQLFTTIREKPARTLREDFCGTFLLCCEWVKKHPKNVALGLDLDPEPLNYGKKKHLKRLKPDQQKRVKLFQKNVLQTLPQKADLTIACNFSFFVFKTRSLLKQYFTSAYHSLSEDGILALEMAGGPGMINTVKEQKTVRIGKKKFIYIWDQKSFNPITHDAKYAIHFKLPSGEKLKDAFEYDWRLWTIPELREVLLEVGFSRAAVYWETSHQGKGTGEFEPTEQADNDFAYIAYVVGIK